MYPLTYQVVYVVHVLYCTVVGLQYLEEYVSHQGILLISQIVPGPKKQRMYPAANACLLSDPVINLQPPPFVDSQLEMVCMNHYYLMTLCIIGILDQYLRNYYFSSVLKLEVYKPESVRGPTQGVMKHRVCT